MAEEIDYPSLQQQGKNLARFTFEVLKEAMKGGQEKLFVNADIQKQRMDICRECPYFDGSQGRCKHCGCFLVHKVKFSLESCPIDKWHVSDTDWMEENFNEVAEKVLNPDPEVDRPRFPADVVIGDKYSWKLPEPDGRVMHWFWNGATWEFDPDPETPNYSDEEIAAYKEERAQIQREEMEKQGVFEGDLLKEKTYEQEAWERHLRREAGEDVPDEDQFLNSDGSSLEGLLAQYRRKEQMTDEKNEEMAKQAEEERQQQVEEVDDEEINLIDSIISDVMSDPEVLESVIEKEEEKVVVEEPEAQVPEAQVPAPKKKRTYKKRKTTTASTSAEGETPKAQVPPKKKRGRPKKVKTDENTETTE